MNFFTRLWKNINKPVQLNCPRCLGKGHVDKDDIIRLKREDQWVTGKCAYCNGSGKVDETMLSKIPADAAILTTDLSETERNDIINNFHKEPEPVEKRDDCPVSEPSRLWLEESFLLLLGLFGKENIQQRKVLVPQYADFPFKYDGSGKPAYETMKIVSAQMEVPFENILLTIYDDGIGQVSTGSPYGTGLFLESDKDDKQAAGLYWGQAEHGNYEIWVNRDQLTQPENLVATLAHEIAHIKLLGRKPDTGKR